MYNTKKKYLEGYLRMRDSLTYIRTREECALCGSVVVFFWSFIQVPDYSVL